MMVVDVVPIHSEAGDRGTSNAHGWRSPNRRRSARYWKNSKLRLQHMGRCPKRIVRRAHEAVVRRRNKSWIAFKAEPLIGPRRHDQRICAKSLRVCGSEVSQGVIKALKRTAIGR